MGAILQNQQLVNLRNLEQITQILDDKMLITYKDLESSEEYEVTVRYSPFRIEQRVNGLLTLVVNENDNLYFEKEVIVHEGESLDDPFMSYVLGQMTKEER